MMSDRLDNILRQALAPKEEPAEELNQRILRRVKEEEHNMKDSKHYRLIPAAALAAAMLLGTGGVCLAAVRFFMPAQVTEMMGDKSLTAAFLGEDAVIVNETQSIGGIDVTFMGIASGKGISDGGFYHGAKLADDRSYMVVAIANSDRSPMPEVSSDEYNLGDFFVSPLIQGCDPAMYNAITLGGAAATEDVVDGVRYRIMECDNIEMFADRQLYLCVVEGTFYNNRAYAYDGESGRIFRNESFEGVNALFSIPIDPSKANPEAAKAYLDGMWEDEEPSEAGPAEETGDVTNELFAKLTPDNIDEYAVPVESTRRVLAIDKEGYIRDWDYEVEGRGSSSGGMIKADWLFQHADSEHPMVIGGSSSGGTLDTMVIETFTLNGDGTVTFLAYIPKED